MLPICGNAECIRPDHLDVFSHRKGITSRLSMEDIRQIRRQYNVGRLRQIDLAVEYGVSRPTISRIVNFDTWTRV